ncbi:MAG: trimeric intracellular cation channel family protein [Bacteroidaceae bacterium]|nr:trimeric intracellular cation channel family protein [Bacteroidaceae bacterium]MBR1799974.1 trimeric intracellular cation channel family protein [Bacteroidaceae bacterium]
MGAILNEPWSFVILELIGTLAGAVSGARLASAKQFDLFGALIVGIATACGGGTIRDLMIGKPPFWLEDPIFLLTCLFGLIWVFLFRKWLVRQNNTWFLFDCIGFSLFNVIGIEKSLGLGFPTWAAIVLGVITGAGGGVLRDILINEVPLIFRKEIYATCCLAGGIVYVLFLRMGWTPEGCALLSCTVAIGIRMLAVKYHWSLPYIKGIEE